MTASKPMPWANWPENVRVEVDRGMDVFGSDAKGRRAAIAQVGRSLATKLGEALGVDKASAMFSKPTFKTFAPDGRLQFTFNYLQPEGGYFSRASVDRWPIVLWVRPGGVFGAPGGTYDVRSDLTVGPAWQHPQRRQDARAKLIGAVIEVFVSGGGRYVQ